jgi:hypothetical protein
MKSSIFWAATPCTLVKDNQRIGGTTLLVVCFMLVSSLAYSSTLMMKAIHSAKM